MDEQIRGAYGDAILELIQKIRDMPPGKEKDAEVENLSKLHRAAMEDVKVTLDYEQKEDNLEFQKSESDHKKAIEAEDKFWQRLIDILKIGLPVLTLSVWGHKVMKFEETGSITGILSREWVRKVSNFLKI